VVLRAAQAEIAAKIARLRDMTPVMLDLTIREPATGSPLGHTLADKHTLLGLSRELGFTRRVVATLAAAETVDDRFCQDLRASGDDVSGAFVFVMPGKRDTAGAFVPDISLEKQAEYGTPNSIFHFELSAPRRERAGQSREETLANLEESVTWVRQRTDGEVFINLSDLMDCFRDEPDYVAEVARRVAAQQPEGLMYEDPRGTQFPFQHGAVTRWLRHHFPPPTLILVHPHAGNGMEHASVIESVLAGGDGAWLGFTSHAATVGHASGIAYLTNLMRAGNSQVEASYGAQRFVPAAWKIAHVHTGGPPLATEPVAGPWAYRDVLDNFTQARGYPGDIPAERVGAEAGWRLVPAVVSAKAVALRLAETDIDPAATADSDLARRMADTIRLALLAGTKRPWDEADELRALAKAVRAEMKQQAAE